jgi:predicted DNA-binding transcriptional regulator AlpA
MTTLDLIDTKEIARLLGVTRAHVTNRLTKRPDFPAPAVNMSQRLRKWRRDDVLKMIVSEPGSHPKKV